MSCPRAESGRRTIWRPPRVVTDTSAVSGSGAPAQTWSPDQSPMVAASANPSAVRACSAELVARAARCSTLEGLLGDRALLERLGHRGREAGQRLELLVAAQRLLAQAALAVHPALVVDQQPRLAPEGEHEAGGERHPEVDRPPGRRAAAESERGAGGAAEDDDAGDDQARAQVAVRGGRRFHRGLGADDLDVGRVGAEVAADRPQDRGERRQRGDLAGRGRRDERVADGRSRDAGQKPGGDAPVMAPAPGGDGEGGRDQGEQVDEEHDGEQGVAAREAGDGHVVGADDRHEGGEHERVDEALGALGADARPHERHKRGEQRERGEAAGVEPDRPDAACDDRGEDREGRRDTGEAEGDGERPPDGAPRRAPASGGHAAQGPERERDERDREGDVAQLDAQQRQQEGRADEDPEGAGDVGVARQRNGAVVTRAARRRSRPHWRRAAASRRTRSGVAASRSIVRERANRRTRSGERIPRSRYRVALAVA